MLQPVCHIQQNLRLNRHVDILRIQNHLSNLLSDLRPPRLTRREHIETSASQCAFHQLQLSGFATGVDSLESYKHRDLEKEMGSELTLYALNIRSQLH